MLLLCTTPWPLQQREALGDRARSRQNANRFCWTSSAIFTVITTVQPDNIDSWTKVCGKDLIEAYFKGSTAIFQLYFMNHFPSPNHVDFDIWQQFKLEIWADKTSYFECQFGGFTFCVCFRDLNVWWVIFIVLRSVIYIAACKHSFCVKFDPPCLIPQSRHRRVSRVGESSISPPFSSSRSESEAFYCPFDLEYVQSGSAERCHNQTGTPSL